MPTKAKAKKSPPKPKPKAKTRRKSTRSAATGPDPKEALKVLKKLSREFPDAECALLHDTAHELLVATILSAQCTDVRVNLVTRKLFKKYPHARAFAHAAPAEMEEDVRSTGFFRNKARAVIEMSQDIVSKHGGEIPRTMEELTALRGVGRKTANVLLGNAFGIPGVVVDTHVRRLSNRLGFTTQQDPVKIEHELAELFPRSWWTVSSHLLILHGRKTCAARKPKCPECVLRDTCPSVEL